MRRRFNESSENDIILNSINELTHFFDDDGNESPTFFNISEITDNYGLSIKEVIDLAQKSGYNVYRIPGGEDTINSIIIAHPDIKYGDIVKDKESSVDIKEIGEDTDDSFNMEEDYMGMEDEYKPFTQRQVFDELKRETNNFTKEDTFRYSFESEWYFAIKILQKHYEDVDWWSDWDRFGIDHTVYIVDRKSVV